LNAQKIFLIDSPRINYLMLRIVILVYKFSSLFQFFSFNLMTARWRLATASAGNFAGPEPTGSILIHITPPRVVENPLFCTSV